MTESSPLRQALILIDEMQGRIDALETAAHEPIAVVGLGCRYPGGVNDPESFWRLLHDGVDAIGEIPRTRWNPDDLYNPDPDAPGAMTTRHGGFLEDVDRFDAAFFRISPREAAGMDPQQRILLEVAWEALENAGIAMNGPSLTAVFVGITNNDYLKLQLAQCGLDSIDSHFASGSLMNVTAGRISYIMGFQGPSMAVDSACSSSLTATHLACRSLRNRDSNLALACGISLILSPEMNINLSKARMMAPDGRCKTFDAAADGYVRGEGCGVVVLQRLSDALRDGNRVLAVIRGSAINNDGPSSGLTVPNGQAQQDVVRHALEDAGVDPLRISYVEAHGTGTPLGDPIEARALAAVLSPGRDSGNLFGIGSVKTNFGHTEAAAGLAGLIKVILSMEHEQIPAHLHFHTPNPDIALDAFRAFVPVKNTPWPRGSEPRIAGVSSFGFSGSNAHVILEEAPVPQTNEGGAPDRLLHILTLSARSETALEELISRYSHYLAANPEKYLADVCHTANMGRAHMPFRVAAVVGSRADLIEKLPRASRGHVPVTGELKPVFLFTGQGSQYAGMGEALHKTQPVFQAAMDRCEELLGDALPCSLLEAISDESRLGQTIFAQPALFAIEYSLAELWKSWGIEPRAVMGHSLGEYVAACIAGVFSLEDGLKLVSARAHLMQAMTAQQGAMIALSANERRVALAVAPYRDRVSIAAVNGAENVVISGEKNAVESIATALLAEGIAGRGLNVSHAFHSPLMEPLLADYERVLNDVEFHSPRIPLVSNLTGGLMNEAPDSQYWLRQMREPVRFAAGVGRLFENGFRTFVEIGPQPTLINAARRCLPPDADCLCLPSLRRDGNDIETIFGSLSTLYVAGANIDWAAFDAPFERRKVALPTYPFQRERFWLTPAATPAPKRIGGHPILGTRLRTAAEEIIFENHFSAANPAFLDDHRIHGVIVVPASCYTSMALSAALQCLGPAPLVATDLVFPRAIFLHDHGRNDETKPVQLIFTPKGEAPASFRLSSADDDNSWTLHASGTIACAAADFGRAEPLSSIVGRCHEQVRGEDFYAEYSGIGYNLGPLFQWLDTIWRRDGEAVCRMKIPAARSKSDSLHPGLIDSCLQLLCLALPHGGVAGFVQNGEVYIPLSIGRFEYHRPEAAEMWCHVRIHGAETADNKIFTGEFELFSNDGEPIASAKDVSLIRAARETLFRSARRTGEDWLNELVLMEQQPAATSASLSGPWAILSDGGDVATELIALLGQRAASLTTSNKLPPAAQVIDLRCLDSGKSALENCARLLNVIQSKPKGLTVVTRGAQADPNQSAVWGLGRIASAEHPEFWRGLIDLDLSTHPKEAARLLFHEIRQSTREDQIAFPNGIRHVARMAPLTLRRKAARLTLTSDATYLITGGFGALGIATAEMLADRGARSLVLVGRSAPSAAALKRIEALESKRVQVITPLVDVANRAGLETLFNEIRRTLPPLRGIVHAAGIVDDALILNETAERMARVLAPKTEGAWNLHELSVNENLDFFVLFSSFVSLMGLPGEGSYAAANAFLDGLAHYRKTLGLPAISINWGPWAEAGMAVRSGFRGRDLIAPADGLHILEDLIASSKTQVTVMPGLRTTWRALHPRGDDSPLLSQAAAAPAAVAFDIAAVLEASGTEREHLIEAAIAGAVSRSLCIPVSRLSLDIPLSDYGLDSLSAFSLVNRIKSEVGVALPIGQFLGGAGIRQIAREALQELLVASLATSLPTTQSPVEDDWETVEI